MKPAFWTDEVLAELPDGARLLYIGLWGLADDNGWFRWSARAVAAELYPYRAVRMREKQVADWSEKLVKLGRLRLLPCGHAEIPTMRTHQHPGGHRVETVYREHLNQCEGQDVPGPGSRPKGPKEPPRSPAEPAGSPAEPALVGRGLVGVGEEGIGRKPLSNQSTTPSMTDLVGVILARWHWEAVTSKQMKILNDAVGYDDLSVVLGWVLELDPAKDDPIATVKTTSHDRRRLRQVNADRRAEEHEARKASDRASAPAALADIYGHLKEEAS